ncbi:PfkB family carbohydrate kinase [Rhodoferax sp. TBRC 17198]|uniref:PfkB family carbohydrate kinase n=1 Tax=Rhodoferax potami TaxID=3068338 RepID=UPI0028BF4470|nr:PfkB family carbohydrate kinase [Rhodoferax sp. TBRC 17198]MDT7522515.1 PfkB family carbohydrate kinase [Rhodoferax sp. TBRC 17198]
MTTSIWVLGEALMDCLSQPDGTLRPFIGGSPYNMARAAALRGAPVGYVNPLSTDRFGQQLGQQLLKDGVQVLAGESRLPTSLAVVQITDGQPSYGFYREGIADRDYTVDSVLTMLKGHPPGVLHTGSLLLVPPEHTKVMSILQGAKDMGWTISVDVNLRPKLAADLGAYVEAVKKVAKLADWIKASDEDLELLGVQAPSREKGRDIAAMFRDHGARRIALTFGGDGAWLEVDGAYAEADVPVTRVVDTVGAGDTFWGNCLGDWVLNVNGQDRVRQTLTEAMQAAAINCARAGCQPPTYEETQALL